jgi:hypothetical protein
MEKQGHRRAGASLDGIVGLNSSSPHSSYVCLNNLLRTPRHKLCLRWKKQARAGGVAQVVEHLPRKCKALSSNSITANKQTNQQINAPWVRVAVYNKLDSVATPTVYHCLTYILNATLTFWNSAFLALVLKIIHVHHGKILKNWHVWVPWVLCQIQWLL